MIFDSKQDGVKHLESMKGDNGNIVDMFDEIILQLPNRTEMYKAQLGQEHRENLDDAFKLQRMSGDKWLLLAKRGQSWIKL